jgi:hypothetical protein
MDFDCAVTIINKLLIKKRPDTFNSSWIQKHAPNVYRFIKRNVRSEIGGIDWDRITRALDRKFQRKWRSTSHKKATSYRRKKEVGVILEKYQNNLYAFITPADKNDEHIRDIISIALVRIAQRGNVIAKEEVIKLVQFTVYDWIENSSKLSSWQGYESLIQRRIESCIRCYRYSGTFIGYLFKTLEYSGRGLKPIAAYSLDDHSQFRNKSI